MNRCFRFLFALIFYGCAGSQAAYLNYDPSVLEEPFEVIHADGAVKVHPTATQLTAADRLSVEDAVILSGEQAHLILSHFTGKLFEFSGDTSLSIRAISNFFESSGKNYNQRVSTYPQLSSSRLSKTGAGPFGKNVRTSIRDGLRFYGLSTDHNTFDGRICLSWYLMSNEVNPLEISDMAPFSIEVKNLFDEPILDLVSSEPQIQLSTLGLQDTIGFFVVSLSTIDSARYKTEVALNLTNDSGIFQPIDCHLATSINYLERALVYMRYPDQLVIKKVHEFLQLAEAGSDRIFYSDLLKRFEDEYGRHLNQN